MTLEELAATLPDYAKDLRLNLSSVLRQAELTEQQAWGTAVATAMASRNPDLIRSVIADAQLHLTPTALGAAKASAAIMGMNNIWYRFQHIVANEKYKAMAARLRMQVIRTHGSDPVDFELWCAAVSAVNGCAACVSAHDNVLREKGVAEETVAAAVRIGSTMHAVATVLDAESALLTPAAV
jgi:alkyl hydroperoxide reductase subunit D